MTTLFVSHSDTLRHDMGPQHPESPLRLIAIKERIKQNGMRNQLLYLDAKKITRQQLARIHPETYLQQLDEISPEAGTVLINEDTAMNPATLVAAQRAAGASIQATDAVIQGQANNAFCAIRPPGHHAEPSTTLGFCFFNNVALAAQHALTVHGLSRVAILDFDVHHGNGTVEIFQDDPRVLVCSSFQHPFYPFSHWNVQRDHIINTPLAADSSALVFRRRIERQWLAALQQHRPEMIFISAGFDAHQLDPLGQLNLLAEDYYWVTELITDCARSYSQGRVVSVLEGGYSLQALADSSEAHLQGLLAAKTA